MSLRNLLRMPLRKSRRMTYCDILARETSGWSRKKKKSEPRFRMSNTIFA
jgi:hypothetical protein